MSIRILLADDHQIMREGLRSMLEKESDFEVVGEAQDGRATVKLAINLAPDVVVMDIGMPNLNGIEAARQIIADNPDVKVIALSTYSNQSYVLAMLEVGAVGYVLKSAATDELVKAIRAARRNEKYLSPKITRAVVDSYVGRHFPTEASAHSLLTAREREVLQLIAEGKTSKQIASLLYLSVKTVETHRHQMMQKLDLHNVAGLTKYAVREGLTSLETE